MGKRMAVAALVAAGAAVGLAPVAAAGGQPDHRTCEREFHQAVWEDMDSFNRRDEARYRAIIHRDMVTVGRKGQVYIGYDANIQPVLESFKLPYEWSMPWTVTHTVVHGCSSGFAILDARHIVPSQNVDRRLTVSLTLVRERGRWQVIKDTVTDVP
ncbi:DUF4440 domain-containing protein [Actinokineospora sp. UTMC 2448]|uniref:DUF4440 domain-containing protein n=1 Tax=Actinokineospora sp. UTMC 2448 TaxID=2268449 RepID=UPI002164D987|nr:DUF4440 domain-containing protein [Actinokineospora sp. UTMC 2448]UVS78739.1 hypothetical protein Actkin_02475 [Actinokineospora sp. UTMC 2448]